MYVLSSGADLNCELASIPNITVSVKHSAIVDRECRRRSCKTSATMTHPRNRSMACAGWRNYSICASISRMYRY